MAKFALPNKTQYFLSYLRSKIKAGVRQIDIANFTGKSSSYINMLYLREPKNCPIDTQRQFADFFGITYDEMLQEGKLIYEKTHDIIIGNDNLKNISNRVERRSQEPEAIIDQLNFLVSGILKNVDKCRVAEKKTTDTIQLLNNIDSAICTVNKEMIIEYQNSNHSQIFGYLEGQEYIDKLWKKREECDVVDELTTKGKIFTILSKKNKFYSIKITAEFKGGNLWNIIETVSDITELQTNLLRTIDEINLYKIIFKELHEGITFFDENRNLVFSTNRWGILDGFSLDNKPSLEKLILVMRTKIINFDEVLDVVEETQTKKKRLSIDVKFRHEQKEGKKEFRFQIFPLVVNNKITGTILINTPL